MAEIMIDWNTSNVKPAINDADKNDAEDRVSARVIVRTIDRDGNFSGCAFGKYYHNTNHWVLEGYLGTVRVSHWSSLNEPSTACFSPVDNSNKE